MHERDDNAFQKRLKALCAWHARSNSKAVIVQIGANDGRINDPVYDTITKYSTATRVLLIEPQPVVIPFLRENYANHPEVTIWTGAVGQANSLALYRLKPQYYGSFIRRHLQDAPEYRVPTGFTSADYGHVLMHVVGNLPAEIRPEDAIEKLTVPRAPLIDILGKTGFAKNIDVLQVDTEGADDEILLASNLEVLRPTLINFEFRHLSKSRLIRLRRHLKSLGYRITFYDADNAVAVNLENCAKYGFSQNSIWEKIADLRQSFQFASFRSK